MTMVGKGSKALKQSLKLRQTYFSSSRELGVIKCNQKSS